MKLVLKMFLLSSALYLTSGCEYLNRREFCDCMNIDINQTIDDALNMSKEELEEKQKACDWIEEEMSATEILQELEKCNN